MIQRMIYFAYSASFGSSSTSLKTFWISSTSSVAPGSSSGIADTSDALANSFSACRLGSGLYFTTGSGSLGLRLLFPMGGLPSLCEVSTGKGGAPPPGMFSFAETCFGFGSIEGPASS